MTEACGSNLAGDPRWARYPAYKDSGVEWLGEIPSHWEVTRLKNWLETNERVLPEDTDADYEFDYLDIGSVGTGSLLASPQRIRFESAPSRARRVVRPGDTIVSTVRTYLKAVWHADGAIDHLIASTGFAVFSPGASAFPGFVSYLCQSESFTSRVAAESSGVSYPAIAGSRLETLEVSIPPLPEQHGIARFLDCETAKIDALAANQQELIGLLQEKRTALISHAVTKGLDPDVAMRESGVEWLGEIPAHWEVAALQYRYEQSLGKMLDTKRITGNHLVPYLRNVDVQWDHINLSDLPSMDIRPHELDRFTVRPGDLLVCEGGEAGRCAIWDGDLDQCGYQKALHRLRPLDSVRDAPRFLYYTLSAAVARRAFAGGQGSTIGHLTGDMLRAHRFPFPPATEQRSITSFLDPVVRKIDAAITKANDAIDHLDEYRAALISATVTGKIDVRSHAHTDADTTPDPTV